MTGKEALRILCECANGEKKLLFSDSLDLEQIVSKRLEKLEKLERAFEIFKDSEIIKIGNNPFNNTYYLQRNDTNGNIVVIKLTKEEYELIEELMNCGTKDN